MNYQDRLKMEAYLTAGKSIAWIARELGFCERTIYYEKKKGLCKQTHEIHGYMNDYMEYSADKGQQIHDYNMTALGRPLKIGNDHAYANFLEVTILTNKYSPAAALAAARKEGYQTSICVSTLYSYIDKRVFLHLTNKNLWEKGKRKRRKYQQIRRIVHPKLPNITDRPEIINQRTEYGHWEMDLIIGKANTRAALLTLTERKSRQELIFKLPDRKSATIRSVFDSLERNTPHFREKFKSITTDNGPEFLEYDKLCTSIRGGQRFQVWYCHSYAAWEKGSNENHNRMIRRWFPKGTDFTKVTKKRIAELQDWMNSYPRKVLNWERPMDIAV